MRHPPTPIAVNTAGNRSHATRAQRTEAHDSLDDFPTAPWATRALIERVIHPLLVPPSAVARHVCWEPAANRGYMARPLAEYFADVVPSDVHDYGAGYPVRDFLFPFAVDEAERPDWIITNPPFRLAEAFALRALAVARVGVALLVRTQFLEGVGRHERLFGPHPPTLIAQFTERVAMVKGRLDRRASTATAYAWLVWRTGSSCVAPTFVWIPPCRADLDRDLDWPEPAGPELVPWSPAPFEEPE